MRFCYKYLTLIFVIFGIIIADNSLEIQNVDLDAGTLDVYMSNTEEVGGMQLAFSGLTVTDASGGSATEAGWMLSINEFTVLGFSTSATIITGACAEVPLPLPGITR